MMPLPAQPHHHYLHQPGTHRCALAPQIYTFCPLATPLRSDNPKPAHPKSHSHRSPAPTQLISSAIPLAAQTRLRDPKST
jgi:hypothetical protein